MTFHSVVPAPRTIYTGVRKLPPATVRVVEPDGATRDTVYWTPEFTRDPDRARLDRPRLGGGAAGQAARRRRPADGRRRARRGAALRRHRLQPRRGAAGRGRPDRPEHVQHRLRVGRRGVRRRVRVLHPRRRAVRHPAPPHPDRQRPAAPGRRRHDRRDERADGQPRLRRLLPAQRGGLEARQGRAVGAGRRRGARRLRLVPAAGRRPEGRRRRGLLPGLLRPPLGRDGRRPGAGLDGRRRRADRLHRRAVRPPRGRDLGRRGPAQRHHDHARRRPGEAGRQHDDGLGPGGAGALPRPRAGRAGRPHPAGAQARRRRQGRAQAGGPRRRARRGHRPHQGLLPRAGDPPARGPVPRPRARGPHRPRRQAARPVPPGRRGGHAPGAQHGPGPPWVRTRCGSLLSWRCGCRRWRTSHGDGRGRDGHGRGGGRARLRARRRLGQLGPQHDPRRPAGRVHQRPLRHSAAVGAGRRARRVPATRPAHPALRRPGRSRSAGRPTAAGSPARWRRTAASARRCGWCAPTAPTPAASPGTPTPTSSSARGPAAGTASWSPSPGSATGTRPGRTWPTR